LPPVTPLLNSPNALTSSHTDLPYCHPEHGIERHKRPAGIGEILEGYELRNSGVKMHWATDVDNEVVCEMKLTEDQVSVNRPCGLCALGANTWFI